MLTASFWNTNVRDNTLTLYATPYNRVQIYRSTTQTVTSGNTAAVSFDTEVYDTGGMWASSPNPTRITIPSGGAGDYMVKFCCQFGSSNNPTGQLHVRKNGDATNIVSAYSSPAASPTQGSTMHINWETPLVAADYLEIYAQATSADANFGSSTASHAARLIVSGPLPAA